MSERDEITLFLLGELDAARAARVRERASVDPAYAAELARMRAAVAQLEALDEEEWAPHDPPPLRVELPERPAALPRRRLGAPLLVRPAFALAAAVLLLAIGVGAGALLTRGDGDADRGQAVALAPVGAAPRGARAVAHLDRGTLHLTVRGLPRLRDGDFYEVWMLRSPTDLVAMGTFAVGRDGTARIDLPVTASAKRFPILDVSVERPDGDPAHSGDSVLRSRPLVS